MTTRYHTQRGFTLIESMIGIGIFVLLAGAVYQTFFVITRQISTNSENTTVSNLASKYIEIARNIPYAQIGTTVGNPHGTLADLPNALSVTVGAKTYQIYYEVTYVDDPADGTAAGGTDPAPNDYKQVKVSVKNSTTNIITKFVTNIVPTGLENLASGGALSLSVIDAVGQPVPGAQVTITNTTLTPNINITRTADITGKWIEVGLPDSSNSYHVVATKTGYSTDQTYPTTVGNPNPTKGDATIIDGQVTQISFAIDRTSTLTFNTLDSSCGPISSIGLGIKGAKLIGTPNVLKFNNSYTSDGSGRIALSGIEWDNYTPALVSNNSYMIYGSSPIQQINLLPNTTQLFNIILGEKTTNSLLVIVKDSLSGNPIEGASVALTNSGLNFDTTRITGGSLWSQQLWNGGSGQEDWSNTNQYAEDDGGITTTDIPLGVRLAISNGATAGTLTSSTFDTGSETTAYTTLTWQPSSQDPATEVKFQIATNNDKSTWDFIGPDGTSASYYTTPNTTISASNNTKRYIRYKAYLSTTTSAKNPTLTSVGINYISGCFTPGQVMFANLQNSSSYDLNVTMPGYTSKSISNLSISGYNALEIILAPSN